MSVIGHNSAAAIEIDFTNPGNWIALSRDVREHPLVGAGQPVKPDDPSRGAWSRMEAWFDLLCLAQFKPSRISNKGQVQTLDVGQLMGARAYLAGRWNWTEKTVRGYLDALEADGMIARRQECHAEKGHREGQRGANKCNVITITNYSRYQILTEAIETYIGQARGPARGQRGASEGPAKGHNLTSKTLKQDSPLPPTGDDAVVEAFGEFWAAFPGEAPPRGRKTDKPKALETFRQIVTGRHRKGLRATTDEIIAGARRYASSNPDRKYLPQPCTWLNGARWGDMSASASAVAAYWWQDPVKLASVDLDDWRHLLRKHLVVGSDWPTAALGPHPHDHRCVVPKILVPEFRLTERFGPGGISRERH